MIFSLAYLNTKRNIVTRSLCSIESISAEDFFCQNNCTYFISLVVVQPLTCWDNNNDDDLISSGECAHA